MGRRRMKMSVRMLKADVTFIVHTRNVSVFGQAGKERERERK